MKKSYFVHIQVPAIVCLGIITADIIAPILAIFGIIPPVVVLGVAAASLVVLMIAVILCSECHVEDEDEA